MSRSPRRVWRYACVIWCTAWCLWASAGPVAASSPREDALKAGFLINFAQFATWPSAATPPKGAPFVIGVVADDAFATVLTDVVDGLNVAGHSIKVQRFGAGDDLRRCHLIFIGGNVDVARKVLEHLRDSPVLTIGTGPAFIEAGGMVGFRTEDNRLRFEVNIAPAKRAGLAFGSQMLQFALAVRQ